MFIYRYLIFFLAVLLGASWAQENLYGPDAPADAAYVRVLHAAPDTAAVAPTLNGEALGELGFAQLSSYGVFGAGPLAYGVADLSGEQELRAGAFYTLVYTPEAILALEDEPLIDASRALLSLYNLTEFEALTLQTAEGADVITGVAPETAGSLSVNEAEVALEVFAGEDRLGELPSELLERGVAHSVFALNGSQGPVIVYWPSSLAD